MNKQIRIQNSIEFMKTRANGFLPGSKEFILVLHIVPSSLTLIETLAQHGSIVGIIPKPHSIDEETFQKIRKKERIFDIRREDFFNPSFMEEKIIPLINPDKKLIIIDIGGYFAPALQKLNSVKNCAGIIEDTENGLKKYEAALQNFPDNKIPVISIARSRVKRFEDYLVGRAIVKSTLNILSRNRIQAAGKNFGIIGFGEVGRGAAFYLKDNLRLEPIIYDSNPQILKKAKKSGFQTVSKSKILSRSDILICATGNKSITDVDWQFIKRDCFISSCTSNDDEFDFGNIHPENEKEIGFKIKKIMGINLINDGNAVNFVYSATQDQMLLPYLHLTHTALTECAICLDNGKELQTKKVNSLDIGTEKKLISDFIKTLRISKNQKITDNLNFINQLKRTCLDR